VCHDVVNDACKRTGTCSSCETFNAADVAHIKSLGYNAIRLSVVWAGAQPLDEDKLDDDFVRRLDAILDLTDAAGIHVMLDNHGDMVGTANCGNGVPMWVQKQAAPELIGKPLETGFPFSLIKELRIRERAEWQTCGDNASQWAQNAGDPDYYLTNSCCKVLNSDQNLQQIGFTTIAQKTMDYVLKPGAGRDAFVRFWRLVAQAVAAHPSAYACELMNEPITARRGYAFDTWRAAAEAINGVVPDMAVAFADTADSALGAGVLPLWLVRLVGDGVDISRATLDYVKASRTAFYAWHEHGDVQDNLDRVARVSSDWRVPVFATEMYTCGLWEAARAANASLTYWHYSSYCTTGTAFGNRSAPSQTFGACVLGWAGAHEVDPCRA